jgi:hypothetical protein
MRRYGFSLTLTFTTYLTLENPIGNRAFTCYREKMCWLNTDICKRCKYSSANKIEKVSEKIDVLTGSI